MEKTILLTDDKSDMGKTVKMIFKKNKYNVIIAKSRDDLLEKFKKIKANQIRYDFIMSNTLSTEIMKKIKNIKIAFMSIRRIFYAIKKGLTICNDIVDFFQKSFNVLDLIIELI